MTIIKAFIGKHIDLSKIVAISDAEYHPSVGSGESYVNFFIYFQLLDSPIEYRRLLSECDYGYENFREVRYNESGTKTMSEIRLQEQICSLVGQWRAAKNG